MLKKTITFTNFDGVSVSEDYRFNITQTELTELELSIKGGFSSYVEHILNTHDTPALMDFFKMFITKAYGEKSLDGNFFEKSPEMARKFVCSAAYDALFQELLSDDQKASEFIMAIVPKDFADAMRNSMTESAESTGSTVVTMPTKDNA